MTIHYHRTLVYATSLMAFFLAIFFVDASANSITEENIDSAYEQGILSGKINPSTYSKSAFQYTYEQGLGLYTQQRDSLVNISYDDWLNNVNYGAMPDGSGVDPNSVKIEPRSATGNIERFVKDIRKGDIIIVNSAGFGHAAIATTNNWIIEMSGGGNIINWTKTGIPDNNHQFRTRDWAKNHIKNWIEIWRPRNGIGSSAATYADATFWSSTHGTKKNRHITYGIVAGPRTTNPNYCSKMVWQSFWFGTGNKNVATGTPAFITPKALPTYFYKSYAPYKVGRY
ncbi:hypothetical protein ACFP1L_00200 [Lactiplantibacillus nangangensis]|uniref:Uncharacterized protein n=1 Tax=Lactiplantibacillus nangangensis TaxID=2559917 RepID=A0ABW1SFJ9_9LACO|nr:hypothetical protein [Lactiplantibacillus nangangensis]